MKRGLWFASFFALYAQAPAPWDNSSVAVRIRFGVTDAAPKQWAGTVTATGGQVTELRNWRPRPGDAINGTSAFTLATRQGINFVKRPWEQPFPDPQRPYLTIPGLIVDAKGGAALRLRVATGDGAFDVSPVRLALGESQSFLNGKVTVDRVANAQSVSEPGTASDYAAIAAAPNGELFTAWVAFKDNKTSVRARRFDGRAWGAVQDVSGPDHSDIFLVKAARDNKGGVWMVWASQINGNFDLYARRWDGSQWSAIDRLTDDPQPDVYHAVTTDSTGNVWVTWQGFRNGKSDIFARRWNGSWSPAEKVSESPANDWQPAIAADNAGRVYVGWDTYDKGNYDAVYRKWENGQWSPIGTIANTARFEAYLALACDKQNRLWAVWNEAGFEWGKDTGFLVKLEGTPLYLSRTMRVAVLEGNDWKEPATQVEQALPAELRDRNDKPELQTDANGRVWLFFRHRMARIQDIPAEAPLHRAAWEIWATTYDGSAWSKPALLPFSAGRQDVRAGFATGPSGAIYAAYPTDGRDFEEYLSANFSINAARIPVPSTAPAAPRLTARDRGEVGTRRIHLTEAKDLAAIRAEAWPLAGKTYKIFRGDIHRHTEISMDGNNDGSLLDAYRYAIDAASLDYLMVSEHNGMSGPDIPYINFLLQQMADVFYLPGTFVPLYGYERSVVYPNGHRNIVFARRGNPTLPIPAEEQKGRVGAAKLYEYLKKYDGIAVSHTSATTMGTDWRDNDPAVEPLVEIYQGDRVSAEYEGAPKAAYKENSMSAPGGFKPAGYVWNAWAKGYKLGIQASSDHLSTHISYASTIASDFTRQGLLDAMKARHSYGATDNIILDYRIESAGKQYLQGEEIQVSGPFQIVVNVKGTKPIRQIDIVKNNRFIHTRQPLEQQTSFRYLDAEPLGRAANGPTYYYVRVQQVDDQIAWSSPIWVNAK